MSNTFITQVLQGPAALAVSRQVTRPLAPVPSAAVNRPKPSAFVQQDLYPVRRVEEVSDDAIQDYATQYGDDDGGPTGTGYAVKQAGPLDLTVRPFVRGTDRPEDVPGSILDTKFELSANYASNLLKESFGFGSYKYNELTGRVEPDYLKDISYALPPTIAAAAGIGQALNRRNLMRIGRMADAQEEGYALGMLGNQVIGVSPGLFGGYTLSGTLPQNLTHQQRQTIAEQLLGISEQSRSQFKKQQEERQRRIDESQADQIETDAGAGLFQPGDTPAQPDPRYTPPPPVTYNTDPGESGGTQYSVPSTPTTTTAPPSYSYTSYEPSGGGEYSGNSYSVNNTSSNDSKPGGYSMRAEGGRISMADGGGADPVQGNGFVAGSPDNYTKSQTVADDEFRQVRVGSFVLNAPATEELQKKGMLPTGVDNSHKSSTIKASKGGMMDVALSKGEYVLEPEEAERIGYDVLTKINNKGKAEVDRRQAAAGGGFIDGYAAGDVLLPTPSPVRQAAIRAAEEDKEVVEKPLTLSEAYERIKDRFPTVEEANKEIDKIIDELPAPDVLAFMMIREASVLGREGMRASGHVAMNRVNSEYKDFAKITDLRTMAKAKTRQGGYQFNVFNISDFREGLEELTQTEYGRQSYQDVRDLAEEIFYELDEDNTRGALFFRNPAISSAPDFEKNVRDAKYIPTLTVRGEKATQEYYRPIELMDAEDTRYIY